MASKLDWLFFDVGNVLLRDQRQSFRAYEIGWRALRSVEPDLTFTELLAERERRAAVGQHFVLHRIVRERLGEAAGAQVLAAMRAELAAEFDRNHTPSPGVLETLRELSSSYRLGVIANQPAEARHGLARRGLLPLFEVVGISEELDLHKPDPAFYRWAVRAAEADGERCLMVGDRLDNDVAPARAVGMATIHLRWPAGDFGFDAADEAERTFQASAARVALFPAGDAPPADRTVDNFPAIIGAVAFLEAER